MVQQEKSPVKAALLFTDFLPERPEICLMR
jgi:hypothetical protein